MIRDAVGSDQAFIAKTWAKSICSMNVVPGKGSLRFGHGHAIKRHLGSDLWTRTNADIDAVMDRQDSRAIVVCNAHDRNAITAYLVYAVDAGAPLVHYLYARDRERGRGVAADLLHHIGVARSTAVVCTSVGPSSEAMRARYASSTYLPIEEFLKPGGRK